MRKDWNELWTEKVKIREMKYEASTTLEEACAWNIVMMTVGSRLQMIILHPLSGQ